MTRCSSALLAVVIGVLAYAVVADDDAVKVSYEGFQLWRVSPAGKIFKDDFIKLDENGDIMIWAGFDTRNLGGDMVVKPTSEAKVKEFLSSHNLTYEVVIENLQRAIDDGNPVTPAGELDELQGRKGHRMTWTSYHRLSDIHGFLDYMAQTFPDLCSVQTIGNSVEGRPLKVLTIKSGRADAPAIWIDGGIHAREWISPATVTYIINEIIERREQHGLQDVDFHIHAVVNPDGYEYTHETDRLWRKNRGNIAAGNCSGIDLNRNFGYKWGGPGSSKQPCKITYAGASQFSEPETKAIMDFVLARNSTIKAYLSFHSYGEYVLFPWGYDRVLPPDYVELQKVGNEMGAAMHTVASTNFTVGPIATTLYPASGASDDWAKGVAMIKYTYTIELRDKGRFGFVLPPHLIEVSAQEALEAVKILAKNVVK